MNRATGRQTRVCPRCALSSPVFDLFCAGCGNEFAFAASALVPAKRRRLGGTVWFPEEDASLLPSADAAPLNQESSTQPVNIERKRRKHRRKPWFRKPLVVVPLLIAIVMASAAGALAYRAQATINSINEVSVLPEQVTDSTVGENANPLLSFDTAPAKSALEAAGVTVAEESGGIFGKVKTAAGDVGDLASGAAIVAGVKDPSSEAITILVMGVDARPGAPIDIGVRPDALMVLYLNPSNGACRGLAIPRDSLVELPGYGQTKINHALMVAGIPYQQLVVEQFLGLDIDHYALIDFAGFQELVDAVGGVPVTVPSELTEGGSTVFSMGPQTFDGETALAYARYRGADDVDVGRVRRQQQIIRGLIATASGRNIATDINNLLPALTGHVRTDLSSDQLLTLVEQYRSSCTESGLELDALQGNVVTPFTLDPLYQQSLTYMQIDQGVVEQKVTNLVRE